MKVLLISALAIMFASAPTYAQEKAQEWNRNLTGWNLGNQFECSAPGQDGESVYYVKIVSDSGEFFINLVDPKNIVL